MKSDAVSRTRNALRFYWAALVRSPAAFWRALWGAEALRGVLVFTLLLGGGGGAALVTLEKATVGYAALATIIVVAVLTGIYDVHLGEVAKERARFARERSLRIKVAARNAHLRIRRSEDERIRLTRNLFSGAARDLERAIQALPDKVPTVSWSWRFTRLVPEAFALDSQAPGEIFSSLSYSLQSSSGITLRTAIGAINEVMSWVVPKEIAQDFDPGNGEWESWGPSKKLPMRVSGSIAEFQEKLLQIQAVDSPEAQILKSTKIVGGAPLKAFVDCRHGIESGQFSEFDVLRAAYGEEPPEDDDQSKEQMVSAKKLCTAFVRAGLVTTSLAPKPREPDLANLSKTARMHTRLMQAAGMFDPPEFWLSWTEKALAVEQAISP